MDLLCICSEEWCYCTNIVRVPEAEPIWPTPEVACDNCTSGNHVTSDEMFNVKVAEYLVAHG